MVVRSELLLLLLLDHGAGRRGGEGEGNVGQVASGVADGDAKLPLDHTDLDLLPLVLPNVPADQSSPPSKRKNSLVKDITPGVLVILAPFDDLAPDIPYRDTGMVVHLGPALLRSLVLAVRATREVVELGEDATAALEVAAEDIGLLEGRDSRGDRADEGDGVRVDGKIVVEGVVEEGV